MDRAELLLLLLLLALLLLLLRLIAALACSLARVRLRGAACFLGG